MHTVTAPPEFAEVLHGLPAGAEIHDANGQLLGLYVPLRATKEAYARAVAQFDPEVSLRRLQSGQRGYTLSEVLAHLKSLEQRS